MFLSCSLLSPDMVQSIGDKICQRCGYGLLVLDDCDMGDNTTSEMVTSIVSDVTGRYQVRAERIKCGDKFLFHVYFCFYWTLVKEYKSLSPHFSR